MNNRTQLVIRKPASEVFDAIVNPSKIGGFWFSGSSQMWEEGTVVTLVYAEYSARVDIRVLRIIPNEQIMFRWGRDANGHEVTISLRDWPDGNGGTIIDVVETGFDQNDLSICNKMLDNKEGWVYMLTCLKAYMEYGITTLRGALIKE